jgi:hypothetical protein
MVGSFLEMQQLHVPVAYGAPPNGWSWSRLDAISEGVFDCPHSTPNLTVSGSFVVRRQDIITGVFRPDQTAHVSDETYEERIARVIPSRGDLLYSREGTYFGIAAEVPENTQICLGQRMVLIRPDKRRLDFRYLRYWLNFEFGKGSYGPFTDEVKLALHDFANRNWLQEERLGQVVALRVGPQYQGDRAKFADVLKLYARKIAKTVDLFSRIKNTKQAEELLTVLYASRELKKKRPSQEVAEQQLYDFVLDWKKTWRTEEKQQAVASAIRNLIMLGWMKLQFSESLPEAV